VAELPDRIAVVQKLQGLSEKDAAQWIEKIAHDRHRFVKKNFARNLSQPEHYDLLLNTSRWTEAEAAALIEDALRRLQADKSRGTAQKAPAESATAR
jgi:hypothetical protein